MLHTVGILQKLIYFLSEAFKYYKPYKRGYILFQLTRFETLIYRHQQKNDEFHRRREINA